MSGIWGLGEKCVHGSQRVYTSWTWGLHERDLQAT